LNAYQWAVVISKSPYHFLFAPVLVDAKTGKLAAVVKMPFYLRALEVSRPLHFGDYGGLPLKILWVVFDLLAIVVLISGLYLWFDCRKLYAGYFKNLEIK
jgi:uncharacterized iron-regulated membrane protein